MKNSENHRLIEKLIEKRRQENTALQKLLTAIGHKIDSSGGEKESNQENRENNNGRQNDIKK